MSEELRSMSQVFGGWPKLPESRGITEDRIGKDLLRDALMGGGGGIYYTREVHNMNNEFTEDKRVVVYG